LAGGGAQKKDSYRRPLAHPSWVNIKRRWYDTPTVRRAGRYVQLRNTATRRVMADLGGIVIRVCLT
jgi:hypothetical protein